MNQTNTVVANSDKRSKTLKPSDFFKIFRSSLFFTFVIILFLGSVLLLYPQFNAVLVASSQNILGILTSVFVHRDIGHFASNMLLYFMALLLCSFSWAFLEYKKLCLMTLTIWFSAILANLVYILVFPSSEVAGSSGIVSAFFGGAVAVAFISAWKERILLVKVGQSIAGSLLFLVFIVVNISVSADTNVLVHVISFLLSAIVMMFAYGWKSKPP